MRIMGGKARLAKRICAILEAERKPGQRFVDVFTGGANIVAGMGDHGPRVANDGCVPLINLYRAWLAGWRPPADVSEDLYREVKARQDPDDPLTAFVGFGCSFGGKWFGGYAAHGKPRPKVPRGEIPAQSAARSLARKLGRCRAVSFTCLDFADVEVMPGDLVYCDTPYLGTTPYAFFFDGFDHAAYVRRLDEWAGFADVFVSEYEAQASSWRLLAEIGTNPSHLARGKIDRLYLVSAS